MGIELVGHTLIFSRCGFVVALCEASLFCRHHGTCLNIYFHDIDRGGESHGGYDQRFAMTVKCISCDEDFMHIFLCVGSFVNCSSIIGKRGSQHRCTVFLVVLFEYQVTIFQDESLRSRLHWLYGSLADGILL
jgi:hypothetical protein